MAWKDSWVGKVSAHGHLQPYQPTAALLQGSLGCGSDKTILVMHWS